MLTASTTQLASSVDPATFGQTVVFTATVSPATGRGTPTGTVTFTIDGQAQAPSAISMVNGVDEASFSTASLAVGARTIGATYSGDTDFASSRGDAPLIETITAPAPLGTSTQLTPSTNPSTAGQGVVFTATVLPMTGSGMPTGTVTFAINGQAGSPVPLAEVGGREEAAFTMPALAAGNYTITAAYSGDTVFATSASSPADQVVNPSVSSTTSSTTTTPTTTTTPGGNGPTVHSVKHYGYHMMPTTVVMAFDQALDAATAQDVNDYRIIGPSGRRSPSRARCTTRQR